MCSVAERMREAISNGAAPTPERPTVRQLLGHFGYQKRGDYIVSHIRNSLERHKLIADQDFGVGWIDSTITVQLDSDAEDAHQTHLATDPTHRIGALDAANNKPMSVPPDRPLSAAATIMQLHDLSSDSAPDYHATAMSTEHSVSGIVSWKSIGTRHALGRECKYVRDCMDPHEEVPVTAPLFEAIAKIAEHGYVIVLQPQILVEVFQAALVVAVAGPGLVAPPPTGPRQHRFAREDRLPDQPVQQPAYLGNRQRYQGFIPPWLSPFLPLKQALACCRTTAR